MFIGTLEPLELWSHALTLQPWNTSASQLHRMNTGTPTSYSCGELCLLGSQSLMVNLWQTCDSHRRCTVPLGKSCVCTLHLSTPHLKSQTYAQAHPTPRIASIRNVQWQEEWTHEGRLTRLCLQVSLPHGFPQTKMSNMWNFSSEMKHANANLLNLIHNYLWVWSQSSPFSGSGPQGPV